MSEAVVAEFNLGQNPPMFTHRRSSFIGTMVLMASRGGQILTIPMWETTGMIRFLRSSSFLGFGSFMNTPIFRDMLAGLVPAITAASKLPAEVQGFIMTRSLPGAAFLGLKEIRGQLFHN